MVGLLGMSLTPSLPFQARFVPTVSQLIVQDLSTKSIHLSPIFSNVSSYHLGQTLFAFPLFLVWLWRDSGEHMLSNQREDLDKLILHFTKSILTPRSWLKHGPMIFHCSSSLSHLSSARKGQTSPKMPFMQSNTSAIFETSLTKRSGCRAI